MFATAIIEIKMFTVVSDQGDGKDHNVGFPECDRRTTVVSGVIKASKQCNTTFVSASSWFDFRRPTSLDPSASMTMQ